MIEERPAPVLVAVAPNGARHQKTDHPNLPLKPDELAATAAACAEAGAAMIHLHVRDENEAHSLDPAHYRPAIRVIRQAVGDTMLLQVTSEAAGVYAPDAQIRLIDALAPAGVSVAIREFFVDGPTAEAAVGFLARLRRLGTLVQYILYDPDDVRRYRRLAASGAIPGGRHLVLFVLGRYSNADAAPDNLEDYVTALGDAAPWMACAFGRRAFEVLAAAASSGGHVRIGFENGWCLPDGRVAADNATLVRAIVARVRDSGFHIASADDACALWERL